MTTSTELSRTKLIGLSKSDKQRLLPRLRVTGTATKLSWSPHNPWPKQQAFLNLDCKEVFFGGAAGGGKSDVLLMAALEYVDVPHYHALILRQSYARLKRSGAIMQRAKEWLAKTPARWNGTDHTFTFPSGARLEFGFVDNPDDALQFQGTDYQFIGWDELTEFRGLSEEEHNPYKFLNRSLRQTETSLPLRIRATSNPGNIGHLWVKNRFISDEAEEALKVGKDGIFWKDGRAFVPSRIRDNPALDEATYRETLADLPPIYRERLMNGDWSIQESSIIRPDWLRYYYENGEILVPLSADGFQIGPEVLIDRRECQRFATIDTAGTSKQKAEESKGKPPSWSVCAVWDWWPAPKYLFLCHIWRARVDFNDLVDGVRSTHKAWKPLQNHIENAHLGPALHAILQKEGLPVVLVNTSTASMKGKEGKPGKVERATPLLNMLSQGRVFLPRDNNSWRQDLEAEWLSWTGLPEETADQIDVASYAAILADGGGGVTPVDFPFWQPSTVAVGAGSLWGKKGG